MLDAARNLAVFCLFPKHLMGIIFKSNGLVYLKEEMSNSQIPRLWSGYFSLLLVRLHTKNLEGGKERRAV